MPAGTKASLAPSAEGAVSRRLTEDKSLFIGILIVYCVRYKSDQRHERITFTALATFIAFFQNAVFDGKESGSGEEQQRDGHDTSADRVRTAEAFLLIVDCGEVFLGCRAAKALILNESDCAV